MREPGDIRHSCDRHLYDLTPSSPQHPVGHQASPISRGRAPRLGRRHSGGHLGGGLIPICGHFVLTEIFPCMKSFDTWFKSFLLECGDCGTGEGVSVLSPRNGNECAPCCKVLGASSCRWHVDRLHPSETCSLEPKFSQDRNHLHSHRQVPSV